MKPETIEKVNEAMLLRGFRDKSAEDKLNVVRLEKEIGEWTLVVWGRDYSEVFVDLQSDGDSSIRLIVTESIPKIIVAVKAAEDFIERLKAIRG